MFSRRRFLALFLISSGLIALWLALDRGDYRLLLNQPLSPGLAGFVDPSFNGDATTLLISDNAYPECNERHTEWLNLTTRRREQGDQMQMLLLTTAGFPHQSFAEAARDNRGAPTHMILADRRFLHQDRNFKAMPKPAVLLIEGGVISEILIDEDFEDWLAGQ